MKEKEIDFDFKIGMKPYQIMATIKEKALSFGKTDKEFMSFQSQYRVSIKKEKGMLGSKELANFIKQSKVWLNDAVK